MKSKPQHTIWIRRLAALLSAVCLLILSQSVWRRSHRAMTPLQISMWYWQIPFHLEQDEVKVLANMGVRQLFVIAGTFQFAHSHLQLTLPQIWDIPPGAPDVTLVFHIDSTLVRQFEKVPTRDLADSMRLPIQQEVARAARAGARVRGVQIDMDCPTRLLNRYSDLLKNLQGVSGPGGQLSATALSTWYSSKSIGTLAAAVNFLVPQYYEAQLPSKSGDSPAISDVSRLKARLKRAGDTGMPFWAGLPAYGHALLYDDSGKLRGLYHELPLSDAFIHPAFQLEKSGRILANGSIAAINDTGLPPGTLENGALFRAIHADRSGKGNGWKLLYTIPTPELLRKELDIVNADRPDNCVGVLLFRYPQPGELLSLPLVTVEAAIRGKPSVPDLSVKLSLQRAAMEAAEAHMPLNNLPQELTLRVTNTGNANAMPTADAIEVVLDCETPGVLEADAGQFDTMETWFAPPDGSSPVRCAMPRANRIRLLRHGIYPGQTIRAGSIRVAAQSVQVHWSVLDTAGHRHAGATRATGAQRATSVR